MIDDGLKFSYHISSIAGRLSRSVGIMYRLSSFIPKKCLRMIYFSIFYYHFIYCIVNWGRGSAVCLNRIRSLQSRAIKLFSVDQSTNLFRDNYLLTFNNIINYFTVLKFYKIIFINESNYFKNKVYSLLPAHHYNTRNNDFITFNVPHYNKSLSQRFFLYNAVISFNLLPSCFKIKFSSLDAFKRQLKKHYMFNL